MAISSTELWLGSIGANNLCGVDAGLFAVGANTEFLQIMVGTQSGDSGVYLWALQGSMQFYLRLPMYAPSVGPWHIVIVVNGATAPATSYLSVYVNGARKALVYPYGSGPGVTGQSSTAACCSAPATCAKISSFICLAPSGYVFRVPDMNTLSGAGFYLGKRTDTQGSYGASVRSRRDKTHTQHTHTHNTHIHTHSHTHTHTSRATQPLPY